MNTRTNDTFDWFLPLRMMACMMSQELFADLRLAVFAPFPPRFFVFFPVLIKTRIFFGILKNRPSLVQVSDK